MNGIIISNPILEYNPNQMAEVRKIFRYDDISMLHQDLTIFENWIKAQHHFLIKEFDKKYLERCLINSKGSIERAKKLLDKMCTFRGLMPEYLAGYDIENEFKILFKTMHACVLPKPTPEHYRIIYYTVHNPDAELFEHITICRYVLLILQYLNCHDYNAGIRLVCDISNINYGIITKLSPIMIAKSLMIITEAFGLRLRGLHLINGSNFIDTILVIIKQGLSKKLTSRLHVHENCESLFKCIPKDILPKDIGGDSDSVKEISEKNFKEISSPAFIKEMKYIESAATDESKRMCSKFNEEYSGTPGSFKILTVD